MQFFWNQSRGRHPPLERAGPHPQSAVHCRLSPPHTLGSAEVELLTGSMAQIATFTGFRPCSAPRAAAAAARPVQQRSQLCVRASQVAAPAGLEVKTLDGTAAGSASIALRVADESSAKGLVHRYLVMVRQNARQVRQCVGRGAAARSLAAGGGGSGGARGTASLTPVLPAVSCSVAGQRKHPHPR